MTGTADLFSLSGKTAVVTGTSAGIGARLAESCRSPEHESPPSPAARPSSTRSPWPPAD